MNRLKELRKTHGVLQADLAKAIGIAQPTLSGWETGRTQIDDESKIKLADYFHVSVDYLLGRDDREQTIQNIKDKFAVDVEYYKNNPEVSAALTEILDTVPQLSDEALARLVAYLSDVKHNPNNFRKDGETSNDTQKAENGKGDNEH